MGKDSIARTGPSWMFTIPGGGGKQQQPSGESATALPPVPVGWVTAGPITQPPQPPPQHDTPKPSQGGPRDQLLACPPLSLDSNETLKLFDLLMTSTPDASPVGQLMRGLTVPAKALAARVSGAAKIFAESPPAVRQPIKGFLALNAWTRDRALEELGSYPFIIAVAQLAKITPPSGIGAWNTWPQSAILGYAAFHRYVRLGRTLMGGGPALATPEIELARAFNYWDYEYSSAARTALDAGDYNKAELAKALKAVS